jgi:hypothetical protein
VLSVESKHVGADIRPFSILGGESFTGRPCAHLLGFCHASQL